MTKLQKSLRLNAIFSGISGIVLIAFNKQIIHVFGISNTTVFWVIGIVLLFFASTIIYEIIKQRPIAVLWIIMQDFLWVIGSFVLIAINPFEISKAGNFTISVIALTVLFMGINQSKALAQVDSSKQDGYKRIIVKRQIASPKDSVWKVMSDVGNFHKVAPNLIDVKILSGSGEGLVRSCSHNNKENWTETCTLWEPGKAYSFEVNTTDPNYPYPLKYLKGTFKVEAITDSTSEIIMIYDFALKRKIQNVLLYPLMKPKFKKTLTGIMDNWQNLMEDGVYTKK